MKNSVTPLRWEHGTLWILDQRKLPGEVVWINANTVEAVARAIENLSVRGAPAIGITAGYGVAIGAQKANDSKKKISAIIERLRKTRPTGYNLFHVLDRMKRLVDANSVNLESQIEKLAVHIHKEDEKSCESMAKHGFRVLKQGENVLTYCNTGALATGGIGTALGVIKYGYAKKKIKQVYACETRPVGQGARLTIWECVQSKIPVTLICDNMVGALMQAGKVDRVFVGADRIARNGDTSNKIGTLTVAQLAKAYKIPFHVVAPSSTFDLSLKSGKEIIIEERSAEEVTRLTKGLSKIKGYKVWNPAFDVTPAHLITSHISEKGVLTPPFKF